MAGTKRVLAVPVLYYIFLFIFFLFWLACLISIESMGKIVPDPGSSLIYIPFDKSVEWGDRPESLKIVNIIFALMVFGLIWFTFFLQASNNYVVMVTAATYYFTSNREVYGSGQVSTGMRWAWVHNFGSLAFGSIIVSIIWVIRTLFYYFLKKAEKCSGDNCFVKCISCLVLCCLRCIEEVVEYITR